MRCAGAHADAGGLAGKPPAPRTADGFELTVGVNHLGAVPARRPAERKAWGRGARERWPLWAQVTSSSRTCLSRCLSSRRTPRPASSSLPQGSRPRPATPAPNCQGLQGPPVQTADFDASAPMHPRPAPRARPTAARCGARCTTPRRRAAASARSLRSATSAASRRALGGTWSTVRPARPTTFKSNHFAI